METDQGCSPLPWLSLRKVVLCSPRGALNSADECARWGYPDGRNLQQAQVEHDAFSAHLQAQGVEIIRHEPSLDDAVDACFVCDPALMTPKGLIVLRMGKETRQGEPAALRPLLDRLEVPIAGTIEPPGTVEGGDCVWLDGGTLAVGETYRTNSHGIRQLKQFLPEIDVIPMPMAHHLGDGDCLHLGSVVSFVAAAKALVHLPLAPIRLVAALHQRQVQIIPLPTSEFPSQGCNVLCTAANHVVIAKGNPLTTSALRREGIEVTEVDGDALMVAGSGGPTCLTLALARS